ncbi:O-antigen ligase family protein [Fundidesulfovibrio magnetotacticus]|nr:O-antigen ligase family protein [Fundidesulfovibrio magnetotacticus]
MADLIVRSINGVPVPRKEGWTKGGWVIFLISFFLLGRVQESIQFLWPLRLTLLSCLLAASLIITNGGFKQIRLGKLFHSKTFKYYFFIIIISGIGIPFSIYNSNSLAYFIEIFLQINAIYILGLNSTVDSFADLNPVVSAVITSMACLSLIIIFMPRYIDGRATAIYTYDPNDFSLLMTIIAAFLYPGRHHFTSLQRLMTYTSVIMAFVSVYLSQSRGGFAALFAAIMAESLFHGKKSFVTRLLVFFVLAVFVVFPNADNLGRLGTITDVQNDYNTNSSSGRIAIWERGLNMIIEHPVLGVGLKTFRYAEGASHEGGKWSEAHNSFIEIGAELGVPGLLAFLGMLLSAFRLARPVSPEDWIGRGIRLSLVAFVVGGMFLSWAYHFVLYFFLGIAMMRERLLFEGVPITWRTTPPLKSEKRTPQERP